MIEAKAGLKLGIMSREIINPEFNNLLGFKVSLDERHVSNCFFLIIQHLIMYGFSNSPV